MQATHHENRLFFGLSGLQPDVSEDGIATQKIQHKRVQPMPHIWEHRKSRWPKMYEGMLYAASCSTLGVPLKKEQPYLAANAWWESKRAEFDAHPVPPNHHRRIKND